MHGTGGAVYRESLPDALEGGTIRLCELRGIHLHTRIQCLRTCEGSKCVSHRRVTSVPALEASPSTHDDQITSRDLHWPYKCTWGLPSQWECAGGRSQTMKRRRMCWRRPALLGRTRRGEDHISAPLTQAGPSTPLCTLRHEQQKVSRVQEIQLR